MWQKRKIPAGGDGTPKQNSEAEPWPKKQFHPTNAECALRAKFYLHLTHWLNTPGCPDLFERTGCLRRTETGIPDRVTYLHRIRRLAALLVRLSWLYKILDEPAARGMEILEWLEELADGAGLAIPATAPIRASHCYQILSSDAGST